MSSANARQCALGDNMLLLLIVGVGQCTPSHGLLFLPTIGAMRCPPSDGLLMLPTIGVGSALLVLIYYWYRASSLVQMCIG